MTVGRQKAPSTFLVGILVFGLSACSSSGAAVGDNCPKPAFASPVIDQSLGPGPSIAVRWGREGDNLPDTYWAKAELEVATGDNAVRAVIDRVDLTASHELTLRFHALDGYLTTHTSLAVRVRFPDTRGFVSCEHPGMPDDYYIDVTLTFDKAGGTPRLVKAEVSPMRVMVGSI